LSIVVPLFNEAKGLPRLHERIAEVARFLKVKARSQPRSRLCRRRQPRRHQPHRQFTARLCRSTSRWSPCRANFGKEAALLAGLDHARLGAVLFMDGDGQHPPSLIELLVSALAR